MEFFLVYIKYIKIYKFYPLHNFINISSPRICFSIVCQMYWCYSQYSILIYSGIIESLLSAFLFYSCFPSQFRGDECVSQKNIAIVYARSLSNVIHATKICNQESILTPIIKTTNKKQTNSMV
jgi:hypothetical protein